MSENESAELSSERLLVLYKLAQTFNSSLELSDVLNTVMDEVIAATHAERGFIILLEEDGEFQFRAARGINLEDVEQPESEISHGVVTTVLENNEAVVTTDASIDDRFSHRQSILNLGLRSIMCVPLNIKDRHIGAIYVDNRMRAGIFTQDELTLLNAIASNAAIALENARLYQIAVDKGRMERELQLARDVQESLMPLEVPSIPGWDIATRWIPAREVAGDFFDFVEKGDRLGLIIADVVDKGMPAALFMAGSRSALRASVRRESTPSEIIASANQSICTDTSTGMFLSLVYVELDATSNEICYVNAGHPPPILLRQGKEALDLTRTGMIAGVDCSTSYDERSLPLEFGDFLFFYTDGITDAVNDKGEFFGDHRLRELLQRRSESTVEGILDAVIDEVQAFMGAVPPYDDITLMATKRME